jgi:hypothetical protein
MANDVLRTTGTTLTWRSFGGDYALTLANLASGAARQGAKGDLGGARADLWAVRVTVAMGAAPTNGRAIEIYWSSSTSATVGADNTGACTGTDAAWTGTAGGGLATTKLQLQLIGIMPMTNDGSGVTQIWEGVFSPTERYGMPVIVNTTDQALANLDHTVVLVPLRAQIQ